MRKRLRRLTHFCKATKRQPSAKPWTFLCRTTMDQHLPETPEFPLPPEALRNLSRGLQNIMVASKKQRSSHGDGALPSTTLAWGRAYLPAHFAKPPSRM